MVNYLYNKVYDLTLSYNTSVTNGQTDRQQLCHKLDRYFNTVG